ncbi:hypothetical protein D3C87_1742140 [compost metagenome]
MKNERAKRTTPEKVEAIMLYFHTSNNNSSQEIADHFNMKKGTVNDIIDRNLKKIEHGFKRKAGVAKKGKG